MTEPLPGREPVALSPPSQPITRRQPLAPDRLAGRPDAAELGYTVEIRELREDGPGGWCDPGRHEIVIAAGPANRQVRTWSMRPPMRMATATSSTAAGELRGSSTASPTSSARPSVSTSAANPSPTSPAEARTAPSTLSASTRRRSTRSPAASNTRSRPATADSGPALRRHDGVAPTFGRGLRAPMIVQTRPAGAARARLPGTRRPGSPTSGLRQSRPTQPRNTCGGTARR